MLTFVEQPERSLSYDAFQLKPMLSAWCIGDSHPRNHIRYAVGATKQSNTACVVYWSSAKRHEVLASTGPASSVMVVWVLTMALRWAVILPTVTGTPSYYLNG